jgi:hypothetical protein
MNLISPVRFLGYSFRGAIVGLLARGRAPKVKRVQWLQASTGSKPYPHHFVPEPPYIRMSNKWMVAYVIRSISYTPGPTLGPGAECHFKFKASLKAEIHQGVDKEGQ